MPKCPKCSTVFEGRPATCPQCNTKFNWPDESSANQQAAQQTNQQAADKKVAIESSAFLMKFGSWLRPLIVLVPLFGAVMGWIMLGKFKDYKTSMRMERQRMYKKVLKVTIPSSIAWVAVIGLLIYARILYAV